jgi:DNA-binding transcriptional MerR regulator
MEILKDRYSITELSQRLNVTDHALRFYEKEFSLCIPKDERGRRYYTPELANVMFQIKSMRDEGLEIKAIRRILQSENVIKEPPPVVLDDGSSSLIPFEQQKVSTELQRFFDEFKEHITGNMALEVNTARELITREINKSKLELGACVENTARRLESKLDKHFQEVDRNLASWRDKNKSGLFNRLFKKGEKK